MVVQPPFYFLIFFARSLTRTEVATSIQSENKVSAQYLLGAPGCDLAGNKVSTSSTDHASEHLAFGVPQFLIQTSKQTATGALQHAEI